MVYFLLWLFFNLHLNSISNFMQIKHFSIIKKKIVNFFLWLLAHQGQWSLLYVFITLFLLSSTCLLALSISFYLSQTCGPVATKLDRNVTWVVLNFFHDFVSFWNSTWLIGLLFDWLKKKIKSSFPKHGHVLYIAI